LLGRHGNIDKEAPSWCDLQIQVSEAPLPWPYSREPLKDYCVDPCGHPAVLRTSVISDQGS
jgi:hypothetical protein